MKNTKVIVSNPIYQLYYESHPYAFRFGSYHAIVRSLCIADLVNRLYSHSKLNTQSYQRLMRTRSLIRTLIEFGHDSANGRRAIDIINRAHVDVDANNDDYLYVLSCFFLEPIRWNEYYGRDPLNASQIANLIEFWITTGKLLHIEDMPSQLHQWYELHANYESQFMAYSDYGYNLAMQSLRELCLQTIPFGLRWVVKQMLLGTLDLKVHNCLRIAKPLINNRVLLSLLYTVQPRFSSTYTSVNRL